MTKKLAFLAMATLWFSVRPPDARAVVLLSNLDGNDGIQSAQLDLLRSKGMGFTMPGGPDYFLDVVTLRLDLFGLNVDPIVQIWDNSGSNLPGTALITLANPAFSSTGIANYDFTPSTSFVLQASATYWLVVSGAGGDRFDWKANAPGIAPTGIATHFGSLFDTDGVPPTSPSSILNSYAIQGTAVPEPSALLQGLIAAGLLAGGRLRWAGGRRGGFLARSGRAA